MLKIFAKKGTDEKVLIMCGQKGVEAAQLMLAAKYGGDWILVDKIHAYSEILHFNDGLIYKGFHGKKERYCKGLEQVSGHLLSDIQQ
jgi:hypothetical protein